ncbi:Acetyltransferase (GNAT) [Exophiala dermatitidis]|uniref:GNAT family acetyltransferase n=2 Tax=Exophiala dermatitidis TaxID=5970 RepID=H6C5R4_EXODN|nr:GNAT family acetyltransferase [Exophiala dermatitidis NIH/UT8656]KAJ4516342.1 Acetyltransferase (GNAT) [Exophiala dermatitidis]EHY59060.1 GNAT family acetyltransferase [Exophiala dermatitidis NIH/UT8656]KAJ4526477.1 Acetyltransferase (GNAT) [Exophiala dermatitidis]KAJ4532277.1 Acetyltransferase (GNAT) [Exophiala dermatitidis]KAJ4546314.1 Acetyltransferase (GNAT) [Exophiala dermatitidis]
MAETKTKTYTIRHARQSDVPVILSLIRELADYEKALDQVHATEQSLLETLSFVDPSKEGEFTEGYAKTLLILDNNNGGTGTGGDGDTGHNNNTTDSDVNNSGTIGGASTTSGPSVAGMALYFHNYSTWTAAPGIYLEDLFVRPSHRGKGFGVALLQALARECLRLNCKRLDWSVLKWNRPSIEFYESEKVGAKMLDEWVGMRVDGERLVKLAGGKKE